MAPVPGISLLLAFGHHPVDYEHAAVQVSPSTVGDAVGLGRIQLCAWLVDALIKARFGELANRLLDDRFLVLLLHEALQLLHLPLVRLWLHDRKR